MSCMTNHALYGGVSMLNKVLSSMVAFTVLTGVLGTFQADAMTTAPQFAISILRLPNGTLLTTQKGDIAQVKWKDLDVSLQLLGVPSLYPYGQSVVGNHSQIISQQFISTPNGKAWFAFNKRTPPAASHSTKATYEYWVAMERTSPSTAGQVDYCIEATVIGSLKKAKEEVLQLIANWKVPSIAPIDNTRKPPKKIPVLNIWATPPLVGMRLKIDGWVPEGLDRIKLQIDHGKLEVQRTLIVQRNGYFEQVILLPETLSSGETEFIIRAINHHIILKKSVMIAKSE